MALAAPPPSCTQPKHCKSLLGDYDDEEVAAAKPAKTVVAGKTKKLLAGDTASKNQTKHMGPY
ncbi:hypothetical protein ACP4OV_006841 [Aristida adscensionis]